MQQRQKPSWGGPRPNAGRRHKAGRQHLNFEPEDALDIFRLTKYHRALLGNKELTEEQIVMRLVHREWQAILDAHPGEDIEEMQEPYIL